MMEGIHGERAEVKSRVLEHPGNSFLGGFAGFRLRWGFGAGWAAGREGLGGGGAPHPSRSWVVPRMGIRVLVLIWWFMVLPGSGRVKGRKDFKANPINAVIVIRWDGKKDRIRQAAFSF